MKMRHNPVVSCAIALSLTATTACSVDGQVPQWVTQAEFFAARVNGHTNLVDFDTQAENRDQLKVTMGQPISEVCDTTSVGTECVVEWQGVRVVYSDMARNLSTPMRQVAEEIKEHPPVPGRWGD